MENIIRTFFITGLVTITGAVAGCTAMSGDTENVSSSAGISSVSSVSSSLQDTNVIVSMDENGFQMTTVSVRK